MHISSKEIGGETREMTQQLRSLTALEGDQNLVHYTYVGQLTTTWNSSSKIYDTPSSLFRHTNSCTHAHTRTRAHTHTHLVKTNKVAGEVPQ